MFKYLLLIYLFFVCSRSFALEPIICQSCLSQTQFVNYAIEYHGGLMGSKSYQVINYTSEEMLNVTVTRIYDDKAIVGSSYNNNNFVITTTSAAAPSDADQFDFSALKKIITQKEIPIVVPSNYGPGAESFIGFDRDTIDSLIMQSSAVLLMLKKNTLWKAIKETMGFGQIYIAVVFKNGDVASFEVKNPAGGAQGCCVYLKNSAFTWPAH